MQGTTKIFGPIHLPMLSDIMQPYLAENSSVGPENLFLAQRVQKILDPA